MKKLFSILMVMAILVGATSIAVSADTVNDESVMQLQDGILMLADGGYLVTETEKVPGITTFATIKTITYSRTSTYYNSSNVAQCAIKVYGTFEVNMGVSVKCTSSSAESFVYKSDWAVENVTHSKNNSSTTLASATASGKFVQRFLFIVTNNIPVSITVTCDKNGN